MPVVDLESMRLAIKNVATHGDTDIFPFPTENHIFHDKEGELVNVLTNLDNNYKDTLAAIPVLTSKNLSAVGYNGFRYGTQVDPLWNVYLLGLVLSIAEDLEKKRVSDSIVFSYRFLPDLTTGTLFNKEIGWHQFQEAAIQHAKTHSHVLRCDISDFYPRIYHHRLENAIKSASGRGDAALRIIDLISAIAEGPSYGLPVGGPAARILSETLLNRVDRLLVADQIKFCRFVDDYLIFTQSKEEAHSALIKLSSYLLSNEGLSLQKTKTRILSSQEFLATSEFSDASESETPEEATARTFRRLRVHYDPYSPTADDDYEKLKLELSKFDIVGMLGRELSKSRIDEGISRRLISATKHLPPGPQNDAVLSMLSSIDLLYPIFPSVMLLCKSLMNSLEESTKEQVFKTIRKLISLDSYITQVPTNLAFALRVLVYDPQEEAEAIFNSVYKGTDSMLIKRDCILLMAFRRAEYWISNCRNKYSTLTDWERRALLIASYILGDEGHHWRDSVKKTLNPYEQLIIKWTGESKNSQGGNWRIPL